MKHIFLPPSKSVLHRELIATFLTCRSEDSFAEKAADLLPPACSDDLLATRNSLTALAKGLRLMAEHKGNLPEALHPMLSCRESGTTLRLLLPIACALGIPACFSMEGRLPERPTEPLVRILEEHGCRITRPAHHLLRTEGRLRPGDFVLPGNLSSQYFSGLLFALPLLNENSRLRSESPLESAPYVTMTLAVLRASGISLGEERTPEIPLGEERRRENSRFSFAFHEDGTFDLTLPGKNAYDFKKTEAAEGDWSGAAFWLAAGLLGEEPLALHGLSLRSLQGDRAVLEMLRRFGGRIDAGVEGKIDGENAILVYPSRDVLHAPEEPIDVSSIPDLLPPLALVAALSKGTTSFTHAERLRLKESDRLHAVTETLRSLGADIREFEDRLIITGVPSLHGGTVSSFRDHRIAMTAIAASASLPQNGDGDSTVLLQDPSCIAKSYPSFLADFRKVYPKALLETL